MTSILHDYLPGFITGGRVCSSRSCVSQNFCIPQNLLLYKHFQVTGIIINEQNLKLDMSEKQPKQIQDFLQLKTRAHYMILFSTCSCPDVTLMLPCINHCSKVHCSSSSAFIHVKEPSQPPLLVFQIAKDKSMVS